MVSIKSEKALRDANESRIVSIRDITKERVESYFSFIQKHILALSHDPTVKQSLVDFKNSFSKYRYTIRTNQSENRAALTSYYREVFLEEYRKKNNDKTINIEPWIKSLDEDSLALQHKLIVQNSFPLGEKDKLEDLGGQSDYARFHRQYHSFFRKLLLEFNYYDIFIVDGKSGDVVYSVFKELDYSTSLIDGAFANTGLGLAFKAAMNSNEPTTLIDFAPYSPSYDDPASFIAAPIYQSGEKIGALIFQMPIDSINNVLTYSRDWVGTGLGLSGESYIVGKDRKSRTLSRFLIEDKESYLNAIRETGLDADIINTIKAKNTNIGLQVVNTEGVDLGLSGEKGVTVFPDYRNVKVLSAYAPVNVLGLNWVILTEIDELEVFGAVYQLEEDIQLTSLLVTLGLLMISLLAGTWFARRLTAPIKRFSLILSTIQNDSDLTMRTDVVTKDEIGAASEALNQMLIKLQGSLLNVAASAEQIATASEETSVISQEASINISEQQIATEQVATATNELAITVQEVSRSILTSSEAAKKARTHSAFSNEFIKSTIADISVFAEQIAYAASSIEQLETDTNNISQVVDVIKSIADQTNLLALNAAIEAARAGEQGRGFAVVADEVRTLAGKTQESTEEINQMVEHLQSSARESVGLINDNKEQIFRVANKAREAGESIEEVSLSINMISDMSEQISVAAEEQVSVTQDVNQNLTQIATIAERTATGSNQTSVASQELARLAQELSDLVTQFKLK